MLDKTGELIETATNNLIALTNNKPVIEKLEIAELTAEKVTIKVKAADIDQEALTYKLYLGESEETLELVDIKEKIGQGEEIELVGTGLRAGGLYFFKVEIIDRYDTISSNVGRVGNERPVIEETKLGIVTDAIAEVKVKATDEDGGKLVYTLFTGTDRDNLSQNGEPVEENEGTEATLRATGLESNTKYYYRVDVTDRIETVNTEIGEITTKDRVIIIADVKCTYLDTTEITLAVTATDSMKENLTYRLKITGPFDDSGNPVGTQINKSPAAVTGKQGVQIGFSKVTGLTHNKNYKYTITVQDENSSINKKDGIFRTYCKGQGLVCSSSGNLCSFCKGRKKT